MSGGDTEQQWRLWHSERERAVVEPTGQTALTGTHWISATSAADAAEIPGLPGRWHLTTDGVAGTGLPGGYGAAQSELLPGATLDDGTVILTVIARGGRRAVRTFDRTAAARSSFAGIATFDPAARWAIPATFVADARTVAVTSIDGFESEATAAGWVHFTVDGVGHRLQASSDGTQLRIVFSDASTALGTHRFRFLSLALPDDQGRTEIDFNFAYLPPCAFSDHFLCPLPARENVLAISVEAGERTVLRAETVAQGQR
ncbi:DUF1684 domain-containing protein [Corynebacterium pacaense]|uniref:DUF1684 domain-containing protein n=1 Tax=Corynebacterium pacaense TaxID=1816684 RepID=UPI0009BB3D94|nr:DUF1684 domain-containing protein [Corynebacterium pacaense]